MTTPGVHFVGSIPLSSAEAVFRAVAETVGPYAHRIPDGETGERTGWVGFQVPMLMRHPSFELVPSVAPGEGAGAVDNVVRGDSENYTRPVFRLRDDADPAALTFGDLGYAKAATASYAIFKTLKSAGDIAEQTRFQVCLPTPLAPLLMFVAPADRLRVEPAYEAAMLAELERLIAAVPAAELAVQWDVAPEMALLEGVWPAPFDDVEKGVLDRLVRLGSAVPPGAELGFHLCYGDLGHEHFVQPKDAALLTRIANGITAGLSRPVRWIHLPVPRDRDDDGYFAPLRDLRLPEGTDLFLGLIHNTDGVEGARRRIAAARRYVPVFGIGTECGFGRRPAETVPGLLELHHTVAAELGS
jgi:hypothetical protein